MALPSAEKTDRTDLKRALRHLDEVAPGAPLLALGQSPFWDEAIKAIIAAETDRPMVIGIHDLDYFSRTHFSLPHTAQNDWGIIARNDGCTRDVWVAAGELSALLGAEVFPSRQALIDAGVRLDRVIPAGKAGNEFLDHMTEAWGWRGIAKNSANAPVICDTQTREIKPALLNLLKWASETTQELPARAADRAQVAAEIERISQAINEYARKESAPANELFTFLLQKFYESFLGRLPENLTFTQARRLLRFTAETCKLSRFSFVNYFLDEGARKNALAAYDKALDESSATRLAEGELPFEVHVLGRGRGTLSLSAEKIRIAFPEPWEAPLRRPVGRVEELAEVLDKGLGPECALFGKAIVLPAMLSTTFVMIFNETASVYVPRTKRMVSEMRRAGIEVRLNPILRLQAQTWDSFSACNVTLRLPEHLEQAFGRKVIESGEFSANWRAAVKGQERLLQKLKDTLSPCEFVRYLSDEKHSEWFARLRACAKANEVLLEVQSRADILRRQIAELRSKEDAAAAEIKMLEARRGALNRSQLRPLKRKLSGEISPQERKKVEVEAKQLELEGSALLAALNAKQKERAQFREGRRSVAKHLHELERGRKSVTARNLLRRVERMAEKTRLSLVRNAILASRGMRQTNARPSAWWFTAIDPSGKWFAELRRTARFRLEPLSPDEK